MSWCTGRNFMSSTCLLWCTFVSFGSCKSSVSSKSIDDDNFSTPCFSMLVTTSWAFRAWTWCCGDPSLSLLAPPPSEESEDNLDKMLLILDLPLPMGDSHGEHERFKIDRNVGLVPVLPNSECSSLSAKWFTKEKRSARLDLWKLSLRPNSGLSSLIQAITCQSFHDDASEGSFDKITFICGQE